jgi:hypothetical protein
MQRRKDRRRILPAGDDALVTAEREAYVVASLFLASTAGPKKTET